MTDVAVIVAAGRGSRAGAGLPKQYRMLAGRPLLGHSIAAFACHPAFSCVQVVIHPEDRDHYDQATAPFHLPPPVHGGATRRDSVRLGLEALAGLKPDRVLIHDGARPLVTRAVIDRTLAAVRDQAGAIAALPVTDTLKHESNGLAQSGPDRAGLWRAQTPQGFSFGAILAAHQAVKDQDLTDDAALAEIAGMKVTLVTGDEENLKVTEAADFARAESILLARLGDVRTGLGFDVHAFERSKSRPLMICGVEIPHDLGLVGHSDADIGLHALTDAILGALAAGDIGQHFPPSDPQWRGAASELFLGHAARLLAERGGTIAHVDVTVICEAPKIAPHRVAMQARIAAILGIARDRVGVKATTTEGLGFTGRGEGIAAQAVATIRLPLR